MRKVSKIVLTGIVATTLLVASLHLALTTHQKLSSFLSPSNTSERTELFVS